MSYDCSVTNRKGCNYCLKGKALSDYEDIEILDNDCDGGACLNIAINNSGCCMPINYCPICGKKLV